jgi:hypothetical protein
VFKRGILPCFCRGFLQDSGAYGKNDNINVNSIEMYATCFQVSPSCSWLPILFLHSTFAAAAKVALADKRLSVTISLTFISRPISDFF